MVELGYVFNGRSLGGDEQLFYSGPGHSQNDKEPCAGLGLPQGITAGEALYVGATIPYWT